MYSFNDYQDETAATAIYPDAGSGNELALAYVALGLGGEAGEVQGKIKKVIRDDGGIVSDEKREQIIDEAGDVLWYLARIATECGVSLEQMAQRNVAKLLSRKERGVLGGSGDNR